MELLNHLCTNTTLYFQKVKNRCCDVNKSCIRTNMFCSFDLTYNEYPTNDKLVIKCILAIHTEHSVNSTKLRYFAVLLLFNMVGTSL